MKYKVGDKVKIREDLVTDRPYSDVHFISSMERYKGSIMTIRRTLDDFYLLEEDGGAWNWTDDMFEEDTTFALLEKISTLEEQLSELKEEIANSKDNKESSCGRFRANLDGEYYYIANTWDVVNACEFNDIIDNFRYDTRNYFKEEEEATKQKEKMKIYYKLMDIADRLNAGEEIDWFNGNQPKYNIAKDYEYGNIGLDCSYTFRRMGTIYCLDSSFLSVAIYEIGEDNLEKLFE